MTKDELFIYIQHSWKDSGWTLISVLLADSSGCAGNLLTVSGASDKQFIPITFVRFQTVLNM